MATSAAYVNFDEAAAPATPPAGEVRIYAKTDGNMYQKDDAGVETSLAGGGGSGIPDTILDAKGDLISATAADTPAKLTVGSNLTVLSAASGESTGLLWNRPAADRVILSSGNYTGMTGSFADLTGATLTITTLARRVLVGVVGAGQCGTASDAFALDIDIDGARQGGTNGLMGIREDGASHRQNLSFTYLTAALSAGSHTFKVQGKRIVGSGTITIFMDSSDAVFTFWVQEQI